MKTIDEYKSALEVYRRLHELTGLLVKMEESFVAGDESRYKSMGQVHGVSEEASYLAYYLADDLNERLKP